MATGLRPKFKVHGGSYAENIALQNIQVSVNFSKRKDAQMSKGSSAHAPLVPLRAAAALGARQTGWSARACQQQRR